MGSLLQSIRANGPRYCGVCTATPIVDAVLGFSQKFGEASALEASEASRAFATSRWVGPPGRPSSIDVAIRAGASTIWCTWTSNHPRHPA